MRTTFTLTSRSRALTGVGLVLSLFLMLAAQSAWSLTLGALSVRSMTGQPLQASIEVLRITPEEAASVQLRLASEETYRSMGADRDPALQTVRMTLETAGSAASGSGYVVSVVSSQPVKSSFLDLIVEARSSEGRVSREYTVLLKGAAGPAAPKSSSVARSSGPQKSSPRTVVAEEGETLFAIARREKPEDVTLQQMVDALYYSNPRAFRSGDRERLLAGSKLTIPANSQGIREAAAPARAASLKPQALPGASAVSAERALAIASASAPAAPAAPASAPAASGAATSTSAPASAPASEASAAASMPVVSPIQTPASQSSAPAAPAAPPLAPDTSWWWPLAHLLLGLVIGAALWAARSAWIRARRFDA